MYIYKVGNCYFLVDIGKEKIFQIYQEVNMFALKSRNMNFEVYI